MSMAGCREQCAEGSVERARLEEICRLLAVYIEKGVIHLLPPHAACCQRPQPSQLYLQCCIELQAKLCDTYRHSLFLTGTWQAKPAYSQVLHRGTASSSQVHGRQSPLTHRYYTQAQPLPHRYMTGRARLLTGTTHRHSLFLTGT